MDGINMHENGDSGKKRENGSSCPPLHVHLHHRRSKSASERSLGVSRGKGLVSTTKNQIESQMWRLSTRTRTARSPLRDYPKSIIKNTSTTHRASLEKDIGLLQLQLQQEKSMRLMLERAMGRVSSTLSPGHRHFATQTKELITEIELLEEEVANREKHVLSLYRNMFESCVSQVPSGCSSEVASPAHKKHVSRKHPIIISSSFCSSKNFPLRPFQGMVSTSEPEKRNSKGSDASLFGRKNDLDIVKTCFDRTKLKVYTAENIEQELEVAKREFLQAHIVVKKSRKVFLPKLLKRFAKEASISSNDLLSWVTENVDKKLRDSIQKCIDYKSTKRVHRSLSGCLTIQSFSMCSPRS